MRLYILKTRFLFFRKKIYTCFFILFFIGVSIVTKSQTDYSYFHYSTKDGLSGGTVFDIYQDKYGFMWFACNYGLTLYDGNTFTHFTHNKNDSTSINSNNIKRLTSDKNGNLWIATKNGLDIYDYNTNTFRHVLKHTKFSLHTNKKNEAYCLISGEILKFNNTTNSHFEAFYQDKDEKITSFFIDNDDNFWISTKNKFYRYNFNQNQEVSKKHLRDTLVEEQNIIYYWVNNYLRKNNDILLSEITSFIKSDLHSTDPKKNQFKLIKKGDKIWYTNIDELGYYDTRIQKKIKIVEAAISLYIDKDNNIWCGTIQNGVYLINKNFIKIEKINLFDAQIDKISSIYKENDSILWVTTNGKGIVRYNKNTKHKIIIDNRTNKEYLKLFKNNYFNTLTPFDDNYLLIGGTFGLFKLCKKKLSMTKIDVPIDQSVHFIHKTPNNTYIICNRSKKNVLEMTSDFKFRHLFNKNVRYILNDSIGRYFFVTNETIEVYDSTYSFIKKLPFYEWISHVAIDKNEKIWIGTSTGLKCYEEISGKITTFTVKNNLPSNVIMAIEIDDNNNLWLSTYEGLSFFNQQTRKFINYTISDNLQGLNFNGNCSYQTQDGIIYFGGNNGINYLDSKKIQQNFLRPDIQITDFKIFNQSIKPSPEGILTQNILTTKKIILPYHKNSFSFDFVALNYIFPKKNQYAYRLIGFEKDTTYINNHNTAVYTNIPPGEYTFCVMASNNDKVWNYEGKKIKLIISPPFWKRWWFRILIFVLFASGIASFYFRKINQIKQQNAILEQRVKNRTQKLNETIEELKEQKQKTEQKNTEILHQNEEIKQMIENLEKLNHVKIQFFTNISHEFRTPLSLILAPAQKLINQTTDTKTKYHLKLIYRNTLKLQNLINELLDFRKIEAGKMQLYFSKINIKKFLTEIIDNFTPLMQRKNIKFTHQFDNNLTEIYIDTRQFDKIITNLLSNAYKFTPENGKININLSTQNETTAFFPDGYCEITIKDTGEGIKKENLNKIFNQYYQVDTYKTLNELKSSGIGLALTKQLVELHHGKIEAISQEYKGSKFIIKIPLGKKHLIHNKILSKNEQIKSPIFFDDLDKYDDYKEKQKKLNKTKQPKQIIQIVEDNTEIRQFLKNELQDDYKIIDAENGKTAYEQVIKQLPELIISDVMMPEMDGIEYCKKIKTTQATSHIPVILLTAKASISNQFKGFETGADAYINKPFYYDMLKIRIKNLLHNRELLRQKYQISQEITPENITTNQLDNDFLKKITLIVEQNITNYNFDNQKLFKELGMSKTIVYEKLKALTGESVSNFVKTIRLKKAKQLLTNDKSISEIAYQVGFNNPDYFSKSFKIQFGITPTQYLKKLRIS